MLRQLLRSENIQEKDNSTQYIIAERSLIYLDWQSHVHLVADKTIAIPTQLLVGVVSMWLVEND